MRSSWQSTSCTPGSGRCRCNSPRPSTRKTIEIGVDKPDSTIKNSATWNGDAAHEIVICRDASFVDDAMYDRQRFDGVVAGGAFEYETTWRRRDVLPDEPEPLYLEGLAELLLTQPGAGFGLVVDRKNERPSVTKAAPISAAPRRDRYRRCS